MRSPRRRRRRTARRHERILDWLRIWRSGCHCRRRDHRCLVCHPERQVRPVIAVFARIWKWFLGTTIGRWLVGIGAVLAAALALAAVAFLKGDRKSTRLNSSHPSISYAVFC